MVEANRKNMFKIIGINLILFALLFGLVFLNKKVLRPGLGHISFLAILTGSFPNFIAAYIISLAFVNSVLIRKPQNGRFIVYPGSALVFVVLTIEELGFVWGASIVFDVFDIMGSGLGSLLSVATYELMAEKQAITAFSSEG